MSTTIAKDNIKFLAIADIQYAEYSERIGRYYKNSLAKLEQIKDAEKDGNYSFLINLGDTIDKPIKYLQKPLQKLSEFNLDSYAVLGNHDMEKNAEEGEQIIKNLYKDKKTYYVFERSDWRFIVLDGTRLSEYSEINSDALKNEFAKLYGPLKSKGDSTAQNYNGGIDKVQLNWLKKELKKADNENKKVIIFCHFPLLPKGVHSLYNTDEIVKILEKHKCVKAWINGHNHKGAYACKDGINYITVGGLCEGELTVSYSVFELSENEINVKGYGLSKSAQLKIRR